MRRLPPFRFRKASYAKDHPGQCKRVTTPSGTRWLCKTSAAPVKKKARKKAKR